VAPRNRQLKSAGKWELEDVEDSADPDRPRWWVRVRAAGLLGVLLALLGIATAAAIGALAVALVAALDQALG
jgi:hypothetical protein